MLWHSTKWLCEFLTLYMCCGIKNNRLYNIERATKKAYDKSRKRKTRTSEMKNPMYCKLKGDHIMSLTGKEVQELHKKYILQSWSKAGQDVLPIEKAKGIYFWDYDGKKYADMASLLVCSN